MNKRIILAALILAIPIAAYAFSDPDEKKRDCIVASKFLEVAEENVNKFTSDARACVAVNPEEQCYYLLDAITIHSEILKAFQARVREACVEV